VQNLRRGHCELGVEHRVTDRVRVAFDEIAPSI
jgi:hypothetical protein